MYINSNIFNKNYNFMNNKKLNNKSKVKYFSLFNLFNKRNNLPFYKYRKIKFSQHGEEGIIDHLTRRLGLKKLKIVEFGAWNGINLSNTFFFIEKNKINQAIYIEADKDKFNDLCSTAKIYKNINPILRKVSANRKSKNSLNNILNEKKFEKNFDILSIDIDSYDLDIWESLKNFKPKIVIIEPNSDFDVGILKRHSKEIPGSSFSAILKTGNDKGYILLCHVGNMIFIDKKYIKKINLNEKFIKNQNLLYNPFHKNLNFWLKFFERIINFFLKNF
jgi:hypothetical protein